MKLQTAVTFINMLQSPSSDFTIQYLLQYSFNKACQNTSYTMEIKMNNGKNSK